jgi:tagaturonate reductase
MAAKLKRWVGQSLANLGLILRPRTRLYRPKMQTLSRLSHPAPQLPEKVLQFGTGVLLRGLIDYYIDKANRQGLFNGQVVVVKSTPGSAADFDAQDSRYTQCLRGYAQGQYVEADIVNSSIGRVLSARDHWAEVLRVAVQPELAVAISNTTEVGLQYVAERLDQAPPASFPAKLAAVLHARYQAGLPGLVIVPTELIPDNGRLLAGIVQQLADFNQLGAGFSEWLATQNHFCSSLVDRIVPGTPQPAELAARWEQLGYRDQLLINSETYGLWAIEGGPQVAEVLSFAQADAGVVIAPDIAHYRERKLRLLNGTHTISVCLGYLRGLNTVRECMDDPEMSAFFESVMLGEIAPTLPTGTPEGNRAFAREVLDRFRNPAIVHFLINITLQATSKMKMRNVPTLLRYAEKFGQAPPLMARGFAAYLAFLRPVKHENGQYFGQRGSEFYPIQDDQAAYFHAAWQAHPAPADLAAHVCADAQLWGTNLALIPGFLAQVTAELSALVG